jgi:FkbM family methyltransferase
MKPLFKSKFKGATSYMVASNMGLIDSGKLLYKTFFERIPLAIDGYQSLPELYNCSPFVPLSKRYLYKRYKSGIVVGAGAGSECEDLSDNWYLYDLTDNRYTNIAIGHSTGIFKFSKVSSSEGDTLAPVNAKHVMDTNSISVVTLDSIRIDNCELISIDAEGTGYDVLIGAQETIDKFKPDILVGIYHNWIEYLMIIPFLYELGYNIEIVNTTNFSIQPHLELNVFARRT